MTCIRWPIALIALSFLFALCASSQANLLQNASFEVGSGSFGILPTDWVITNPSPDTFGPAAILPDSPYFDTGDTAHDGDQWVAAYSGFPETFGQTLTTPLTASQDYVFSAWLLGPDSNIFFDGGYEVWLGPNTSGGTQLIGSLAPTTGPNVWVQRSLTFTAPLNSASLPFLELRPYATTVDAYVGIDSVLLTSVPEPSTFLLAAIALVGINFFRKLKGRWRSANTAQMDLPQTNGQAS